MANEGMLEVREGRLMDGFLSINFLHYAVLLFIFSTVVMIVVSKLKPTPVTEQIREITFSRSSKKSFKMTTDSWLTVLLVVAVLILWTIFSEFGIA